MGSIKHPTNGTVSHDLSNDEFQYVLSIYQARNSVNEEYNRVISAFLKYVCGARFGYAPDDDLQFELDFADKKQQLKVTKLIKKQ